MRKISAEELKIILDKHLKWLRNEKGGERANLRECDLSWSNLRDANLCSADLRGSNLHSSNLCECDLRDADLRNTNLSYTNLHYANLCNADLRGAKKAEKMHWNIYTTFYPLQCPEKGSYTAYKKANNLIVELLIPEDAKRSSATSRKCRASKAKVISISYLNGTPHECDCVASDHDSDFIYKIGETVEVSDFDEDRWNECAPGIHHFITREEAVQYS